MAAIRQISRRRPAEALRRQGEATARSTRSCQAFGSPAVIKARFGEASKVLSPPKKAARTSNNAGRKPGKGSSGKETDFLEKGGTL